MQRDAGSETQVGIVMKLLRFVQNHPIVLGSILLLGFGAWLSYDALRQREPAAIPLPPENSQPDAHRFVQKRLPEPLVPFRDPSRPSVVTADLITQLQPGMTRVEVEELIGLPPAQLVHPVSKVDGRLTYRASYLANLEPPRGQPAGAAPLIPAARSMIALEYDATRPGHPLLKVYVPDPMS